MEASANREAIAVDHVVDLLNQAHAASLRYVAGLDSRGVIPTASALEAMNALNEKFPKVPSDASEVITLLDQIGSPATIVLLQAGNINSGASDPFKAIFRWPVSVVPGCTWMVHSDCGRAFRSSIATSLRALNSRTLGAWMINNVNLPQDSAIYAMRDAEAVDDVFGVHATHLLRDERRQPNTFTPELSRRARGVEFWAALKALGRSGIAELIDRCCRHAHTFADGLATAGYEVLNEVALNQVVFACADESATRSALARIQASVITWLGPTHWKKGFAMRIGVSSWATTDQDVQKSLAVMKGAFPSTSLKTI